MVFKVEAVRVLLALHLLGLECQLDRVTIRLNNQVVIAALSLHKPKPAQSIIDGVLLQAEEIWKQLAWPSYRLEVAWVRGHNGTQGNEMANQEAKEAAWGGVQEGASHPPFLIGLPLPLSIFTLHQAFSADLADRWKALWKALPCFRKLSRINPSLPSNGFHKQWMACLGPRIALSFS